jgi:hypothetical protein
MLKPTLPFPPRLFLITTVIATVVTFFALVSLPHNGYVRFNSLTDPEVVKLGWIYARTHFDPTPIDVVFVGSSHTVFGVDSAKVEETAIADGAPVHVVNFALQHLGRDMQWLLAREAIENRSPRLLVIEIQYDEARAMHPAFFAVARPRDLIAAPVLINTSFAANLARLPARQTSLFLRSTFPKLFGAQIAFDSRLYRGPHWDDTYAEEGSRLHPIAHPRPRTVALSSSEVAQERSSWDARRADKLRLPAGYAFLETRASFAYLDNLVALARAHGVEVRFLYLPCYGDPVTPEQARFYQEHAPTWTPPAGVLSPLAHWHDINHLNYAGALALSTWAGHEVAKAFVRPGAPLQAERTAPLHTAQAEHIEPAR